MRTTAIINCNSEVWGDEGLKRGCGQIFAFEAKESLG